MIKINEWQNNCFLVDTLFLVQLRDPGLPSNLVFAVYLYFFTEHVKFRNPNLYL